MPFDKEKIKQKLNGLNWAGGLTKEQMMLSLGRTGEKIDEELYYHLSSGKKYFSADEVIKALPESVWTGVGDFVHEPIPIFGPKVGSQKTSRGKTTLNVQKERTRERHLDEKGH